MEANDFVHLHVHSEYSILDGACRIDKLVQQASRFNMASLAITDHGNLFGAIDFYRQTTAANIKPIIGCEVYIAPKSRHDKQLENVKTHYYHLVLLVKNVVGYQNLMKLVTIGYLEGFYYKPRIDKTVLAENHQGLIGLSACLHGEIPSLLLEGRFEDAKNVTGQYVDIFGKDNFYFELMDHGMPEQRLVNKELMRLSEKLNVPLVATNDCHYLEAVDSSSHDALLCIQTGKKLDDEDRMRFSSDQLYFKSPAEMSYLFRDFPEAIDNTRLIADRCNLKIPFNEPMLPHFEPPPEYTVESYFDYCAQKGLSDRLNKMGISEEEQKYKEYYQRLTYEIEVIKEMKFPGYFLIVWDFINYAKQNGIPVGPGRGSAAGSLVAFALNITDIDPIRYNLVFERFLNPGRISMPDIDIDFCMRCRDCVISYVEDKYGKDNVSQIITFGTMAARNVIRDVGRVLNIPYSDVDRIAKLIPGGLDMTIQKALELEPLLNKEIEDNDRIQQLMEISQVLEGLKRHPSTHAAGVVISKDPLIMHTPLYKGSKGEVTTQYAMNFLERLGLLKMDFLGLRTLTVIYDSLNMIKENYDVSITIHELPEKDELTYKMLSQGKTAGVFQLESSGMTDIVRKLRPTSISDLIALVALYRPGPLGSGMVDDFLRRKHGQTAVSYLLPELEPILKETYGVILYQEQVMKISGALAGYSMSKADELRKAMGKKKMDLMEKHKIEFMKGCQKNNIPQDKAEILFEQMAQFAGYGFNKSHAAAYAYIAYQTAYLKAHYPHEYMAALLTSEQDNTDKIVKYINECRKENLMVLPPDINVSGRHFTVADKTIRFGLGAVKNVGGNAIDSIIASRDKDGPFTSIFDLCKRVDLRCVNKRVLESLIKSGAFNSFGAKRSQLFTVLDRALEQAQSIQKDQQIGQFNLFGSIEINMDYETINSLPDIPEWPQHLVLSNEKECLGFYITGHPLEAYTSELETFATQKTSTINSVMDGAKFFLGGIIIQHKIHITKNKEHMAFLTVEDLDGVVDITVLPDVYEKSMADLKNDMPVMIKVQANDMNGSIKLKALDIIPLHKVRENYTHRIILSLQLSDTINDILQQVKTIIVNNSGSTKLILRILTSSHLDSIKSLDIDLGHDYLILPSETLISKLEELVGDQALTYELIERNETEK